MLYSSYYFTEKDMSPFSQLFQDTTYAWDVLNKISIFLKNHTLGKIEIAIPEGVYLENPELISIGKGTKIEPGVYIKGPVIIGNECKILHGAYIRENTILGAGAVVGHNTEVKNSLFLERAHAAHFNYVGDSILGVDTNLGAGVICANLRLDKKKIIVNMPEKKIETGMAKLGLILGSRSQIGCNTVTSPGTFIGSDVFCDSCITIKGFIPSNAKVKSQKMYIVEA